MIAPAILLALSLQAPTGAAPYWQQRLQYSITATLDEPRGTLGGTQQVVYHNHSPDTLRAVSFHLYLNAFRPGSRWADADSAEHRRRFNDLKDPDYGYNRVSDARVDGSTLVPVYPFAPDSTIVRYALPHAIAPGESFTVSMHWEARPSTVPRRQGRRGRAFDFAQWYPRVVAYDRYGWEEHPLYPAGEFYGDFGEFRVVLDVPEDEVVGATGVPVCGDPGWERANQVPGRAVEYQRDIYGAPACDDAGTPGPGRKRLVWVAKDVHHFAMSMNPAYRYEGGHFGAVAVHALYQPGDEKSWGGGVAVHNTEAALQWLDGLFGPFAWPQLTNVHRIEGGGTEFPMMVHDGSEDLGLIVHEVGHNYLMGILASNEWKEGFLDEGFTSFQTSWFEETRGAVGAYASNEQAMVLSDVDGWSQPTSLVSEHYRDFGTYNSMIYDRGELFFQQLRGLVGDSAMRRILLTYYQRWKLKHVDEAAFRAVAEEVSQKDLGQFFAQFLHTTQLYDYAVGGVKTGRREDGTTGRPDDLWTTHVEVVRKSAGMFPIDVVVRSRTDSAVSRTIGTAEREWVVLTTRGKPREVELDPRVRAHDWNMLDNRKRRGLLGWGGAPRHYVYLDRLFSQPTRRDRLTVGLMPTVWYNDFSGVVVGARMRTDYLGRFEQNDFYYTVDTRRFDQAQMTDRREIGLYAKLRNPTWLRAPRTTQTLEGYSVEGRAGLAVSAERQTNEHRSFGAQTFAGAGVRWMVTTDTDYLDPAFWDDGGTVEASAWIRSRNKRGAWNLSERLTLSGGVEYRNRSVGLTTPDSYDAEPYGRLTAEATARRWFGGTGVGLRAYGGWVESSQRVLRQRQLFVAGADPYQQFGNPFLRSRGSLLAGSDVHYLMPGGGGVRGLAPGTAATRVISLNGDVERPVLSRTKARLFREVRVAAFGDIALANGDVPRLGTTRASMVADGGVGLRISHCIGQTPFVTSLDFPVVVNRPRLAVDQRSRVLAFRWVMTATTGFVTGERVASATSGCR